MPTDDSVTELERNLGFLEAYTIGVGTMIGAGIFVLPGIVANNAGPAGMISFTIGGIVSLLTALSLSELATGMPRAGGSYYYVNKALGPFFGSIVGWGMWGGLMFASAFYMIGFGQYLTYFYGNLPVAGSALVMAALLVGVNYRGVKETGALQNVIVIVLIGFILVFLSVGVFHVEWNTLRPFNPNGWPAVAATAATVYVSFIGFEVIATSAEEIKDPGRVLPLSMIASVLTPMVLYALVMFVSTGVLPVPELAGSNIPVADVAEQYLGEIGALMMVLGALLATISSANASILSAARVNFAMGRDKILSGWLNEVHPDHRTPYRAILTTGAVILALIALGVGLETLADVASFAYLLTYALVHVAVIVMRRAQPDDYAPDFRLPGWAYPTVPVLGGLACVLVLAQMRPLVLGIGGGVVLVGVGWYLAYARSRATRSSLVGEAIAPSTFPSRATDAERVVVSVTDPESQRFLLRAGVALAAGRAAVSGRTMEIVALSVIEIPRSTSLEQSLQFEQERAARQQALLDETRSLAREMAEDLNLTVRTRVLVARSVTGGVQSFTDRVDASHLVLGWSRAAEGRQLVANSHTVPIAERVDCELTVVTRGADTGSRIAAVVGLGGDDHLAVRRAAELARHRPDASVTCFVVQPASSDDETDPKTAGRATIEAAVATADVPLDYETEVIVTEEEDTSALLDAVAVYDTVCAGAIRRLPIARTLSASLPFLAAARGVFGVVPEALMTNGEPTVMIARSVQHRVSSVTEGIRNWLAAR